MNGSLKWDFAEYLFQASIAGQGVLNKDPIVRPDGARPPPLLLLKIYLYLAIHIEDPLIHI